jgi:glycosyl transferase family 1
MSTGVRHHRHNATALALGVAHHSSRSAVRVIVLGVRRLWFMGGFYCIVDVFRMVLFNRSCNWRTLPGPCGERKKLSLNHVHAMPSRIEGLPLVLIEAMLCGRPVVATDVAGAEVIEDEVTGFLAGAQLKRP